MLGDTECKTQFLNFLQSLDNDQYNRAATTLLTGLTKSTELVGQRQSRILTFYTPAKVHGALLATLLTSKDTFCIIVPFHLLPLQHSFSDTRNTRMLIASLLDLYQK